MKWITKKAYLKEQEKPVHGVKDLLWRNIKIEAPVVCVDILSFNRNH